MRQKILLTISAILFVTGITLIIIPLAERQANVEQQDELLSVWEEVQTTLENPPEEEADVPSETWIERLERRLAALPYEVDGVLEIESINLKQPIIAGTSPKKLDVSLNSMNEELKPGVEGNYSIAGHRSYTYGHHFNRLKEVKVDDVIKIITLTHTYYYKVTEVFLVLPNQISVLNSTPGLTEITLITCDPPTEATHRLIIKGVLEKAEEN